MLGLYDRAGKLIHVGQAGTGFTHRSHAALWTQLTALEMQKSPFANKVEASRRVHFVKPELVAQIKFTEWTHEGQNGGIEDARPGVPGIAGGQEAEGVRL